MSDKEEVGINRDAGEAFCMELQERTWFGFKDADRQAYKDLWVAKAEKQGKKVASLRLVPDPLFPMYGKEKPYIEWQVRLGEVAPKTPLYGKYQEWLGANRVAASRDFLTGAEYALKWAEEQGYVK